jgi:pimeloyl-ACP methyl ester carboxylesterase
LKDVWEKRISFTPGWTDINAMHNGVIQMLRAGPNDHFGFIAAFEYDLENALSKIKQSAMILTNTGDDIYFAALRAKELRPDFIFKALADGTHDIVDEQTNEWVDLIVDFIKKGKKR